MNKKLLLILVLFNSLLLYAVRIIPLSGNIIEGKLLSINNSQIFLKVNNKVTKLPVSEIKTFEFSDDEKEKMFFSLNNNYTFKGYLIQIKNDIFIFKNDDKFFYIHKNDLKIIVTKRRIISSIIATDFGRFYFTPVKIISNKLWTVKTRYGIFSLPINTIKSSFRPDISSINKNIVYLTNGDYFFYNSVSIKDSLFDFSIYNFNINIPKEKILFLKDYSYNPLKISSEKIYRLNINGNNYFLDDYKIYDNKIFLDNTVIENPKIKFISNSIINLFVINDVFYSGVSIDEEYFYAIGYSKKLYEFDISHGIHHTYNLNSYSYDFPVIYDNKIFISEFRNKLSIIDKETNKTKYLKVDNPYSGVTIFNEKDYLLHLWSEKLLLINDENILYSYNVITSKRSPLIDYEGYIIDLDIDGNLYKFDSNLNIVFYINLNGKTDYFNIDSMNNIYICGPDKNFTVLDKNGKLLYSYELDNIPYSFPLIDEKNKIVYVASKDTYLYALKNGNILWKKKIGYVPGTGVLTEKYIILNTLDQDILFINKTTGVVEKSFNLGYGANLSMDNKGFLYFASSKGIVAIIDVNDFVLNQYKFNPKHTGNPYIK
ncbi:hypothetical protein XO12_04355 [Marinitoga sp. 1154]|uniref:PQQ-like beta-propeller repeat protein n=1 Tax=Marinitoga sp. 1154 TaxID=1643335 RepID=UPI001586350C|nr:PQQ-like beta-propeller repeat protein [Marinitoga sp. 1154]NUU99367.1 hypothetical protein [Marinitoga sp. 1154]